MKFYKQFVRSVGTASRKRRSLMYVPGSSDKYLKSSQQADADCFIYDLEDSVSINEKINSRSRILKHLKSVDNTCTSKEVAVRINTLDSGFGKDDLTTMLKESRIETLVVPKVSNAKEVHNICELIEMHSVNPSVKIIACIENASGLMNIKEIANADSRINGLLFAAEDYCADIGIVRSSSRIEMLYARQKVLTTARAYGLDSIDLVCVDFKNEKVLKEECVEGNGWGFTGKQVIHPKQISIVNSTFVSSDEDISLANDIISAYKLHTAKGVGSFELNGKMIDAPMLKWAEMILKK